MLKKTIIIQQLFLLLIVTVSPLLLATESSYLKQLEMEANSTAMKSANTKATLAAEPVVMKRELNDDVARLIKSVESIKLTPKKLERSVYEGANRSVLCVYCHGKDGNSVRPNIPNLAAQTPEYLLTQFELFSRGERKNNTMQKLAETLSFNDKVNIALYFSTMAVKPEARKINKSLYQKGKAVYGSRCAQCHGDNAHGNHQMPYLAGQKKGYLLHTLNLLRDGDISRINSPMIPIAQGLTTEDILSLAEYLSVLN